MRLFFCLACVLLLTGCYEQSRSVYRATGTVDGKVIEFEINGLENTVTAMPNINALIQAATAGLKGDIAGVLEKVSEVAAKPQAPVPTVEEIAAAVPGQNGTLAAAGATALMALIAAWSKHKDSEEGWALALKQKQQLEDRA
jgi:hypothetical protein